MDLVYIKGAKNGKHTVNLLVDIDSDVIPDEYNGWYVVLKSELDGECGFTQEEIDRYRYIAYFHHQASNYINGQLEDEDYTKTAVAVAISSDNGIKKYCNFGRKINIDNVSVVETVEKFEELIKNRK